MPEAKSRQGLDLDSLKEQSGLSGLPEDTRAILIFRTRTLPSGS